MSDKTKILSEFELFRGNGGGIEAWFSDAIQGDVIDVLMACDAKGISCETLNQLLILSHEAGVSRGFFRYYFLSNPHESGHLSYDPTKFDEFDPRYLSSTSIINLAHLRWGLKRLYIDSLLRCGNIRQGFRSLRARNEREIRDFNASDCFETKVLRARGAPLPLASISKDDRYLIAEIACKTYDPREGSEETVLKYLADRHAQLLKAGRTRITVKDLIGASEVGTRFTESQLTFSLDEILDAEVENSDDLQSVVRPIMDKFSSAREKARRNTNLYLSMIADLDIYVATSMRSRSDFRSMADFCEATFSDTRLLPLNLRYFDPTLSAADGHEDKGLIECLMVKCAKMLLYSAGARDSYGKDAEAAMALSLGKPVIFSCDSSERQDFFRQTHPLSRLINFQRGVAVGAIVTDNKRQVPDLIHRIFSNQMEYELQKKSGDFFVLNEKMTGSTVRLQTDNLLLRETFWNYYNREAGLQH